MANIILNILKNNFIRKKFKNKLLIYGFLIGAFTGASYMDFSKRSWYSQSSNLQNINLCFTPPSGCADLIAREISHTQKELYIQAYSFTSKKIIDQIIKLHNQNVKVNILLDKSNLTDPHSKILLLQQMGIKVKIDKVSGIAHNKVMIIDNEKVITGSFNFSNDADKRNVENVVLIKDKKIAEAYIQNWLNRYNAN
jgi:phospholipase D